MKSILIFRLTGWLPMMIPELPVMPTALYWKKENIRFMSETVSVMQKSA